MGHGWTTCPNSERVRKSLAKRPVASSEKKYKEAYGHFTHYCHSSFPHPVGYCGSNHWYDIAKKREIIMDKYKCLEYLMPAPPKNPEEVQQFLDKCKTPWKLPRCCSVACIPTCQDSGITLQKPRCFSQRPCVYRTSGGRFQSQRDQLGQFWKGK